MSYGATLTNNSTTTFTEFTLSFVEEQWRRGDTTAERQLFKYSIGSTSGIDNGTFVADATLDLTTVNATAAAGVNDGNLPANRIAKTLTVADITWAPGENLTFKWEDNNATGTDDALAIDDLTFSAAAAAANTASFTDATYTVDEGAGTATISVARAGTGAGTVDVTSNVGGT